MKNIPAYFDGNTVRTVEDYPFQKNQRLVITVLDDFAIFTSPLDPRRKPR